jgi:putative salt-induced outer membrane protein
MNRHSLSALALAATLGLGMYPSLANAESEWAGKGELGFVLARGNTSSDSLTAKAEMTKTVDPWKHTLGFSILRSGARDPVTGIDNTTGNRYELHGQSDYKLDERSYVFGSGRYENDDFAAYDYQAILAVGYGYKVIDSETAKLETEAGIGYRRQKERATGSEIGDAVFRGGVNYEQKLNASTKVYDKLLVESGSNNTFLQNEVGLQVSMTDKLALSVAHQIRHNTDVPSAAPPARQTKKTDQLITANLVFSF